jgi:hypothetical protein
MRTLLLVLFVGGCGGSYPTRGELGRVEIAWDEGLGCLFGCNASAPMAARATAGLQVKNYKTLPAFTVATEDASVLEFTHASNNGPNSYVRASSHAAGSTKLVINDAQTGELIDRFAIEVRDVASIELQDKSLFKQRLTVVNGGNKQFNLALRASDGTELKGIGGVDYRYAGGLSEQQLGLIDAITAALTSAFVGTVTESATVKAKAEGAGEITVTSPAGAQLIIPAAVVGETAITRVEIPEVEPGEVDEYTQAYAQAYAGEDRAWSPPSKWSLEPAQGPIAITVMGRDYASMKGTAAATATVTLTVNGIKASNTVTFR